MSLDAFLNFLFTIHNVPDAFFYKADDQAL